MIDTVALKEKVDLLSLAEQATSLKKSGTSEGGEWAGPCPFCGGNDRFRVQPNHRPEARWLCRGCTDGKWRDVIDFVERRDNLDFMGAIRALFGPAVQISPEDSARLQAQRAAQDAERREQEHRELEARRSELDQSHVWETYYQNLDRLNARGMWHKRGLSDLWIDYFKVGYCPEKFYQYQDELRSSPSLTIPTFRTEHVNDGRPGSLLAWQCIGLAHRLLKPADPHDKYRPHLAGTGKPLFIADLFSPYLAGNVLLVEGEIKAAVTWAYLQDWGFNNQYDRSILRDLQVVGIAGKGFRQEWVSEFGQAGNIWICLDPDVKPNSLTAIGKTLGPERSRIIHLPGKIDDMLIDGSLQPDDLADLMKWAQRVK